MLLALWARNLWVTSEFPWPRPVTLMGFFYLLLLSKQSWCWCLETPSCTLWRHYNGYRIVFINHHVYETSMSHTDITKCITHFSLKLDAFTGRACIEWKMQSCVLIKLSMPVYVQMLAISTRIAQRCQHRVRCLLIVLKHQKYICIFYPFP